MAGLRFYSFVETLVSPGPGSACVSTTSITDLPWEIMSDILTRLPAKSVLICQCVCKTFKAITRTPDFKTRHLNRVTTDATSANNNPLSIYYCSYLVEEHNVYDSHTRIRRRVRRRVVHNTLLVKESVKRVRNPTSKAYTTIGCCNDLFCVEVNELKFLFWNPVTGRVRYLPKPCARSSYAKASDIGYAFGFVPETNDYKVVQIITNKGPHFCAPKIQVYRMSSDSWSIIKNTSITLSDSLPTNVPFGEWCSEWRDWEIEGSSLQHHSMDVDGAISRVRIRHDGNTPLFLNGAFHWIGEIPIPDQNPTSGFYRDENCFIGIVSFDLRDEQLRLVDVLRSDMARDPLFGSTLGVLNQSLCLIVSKNQCYNAHYAWCCLEIWLMNDYGRRESWTKQFTLENINPECYPPVGCWNDQIFLLESNEEGERLIMYNPSTGERRSLLLRNYMESLAIFSFVETLAPVSPER